MTRREFVKRAGLWVPVVGALTLARPAGAVVSYFGQESIADGSDASIDGISVYNSVAATGVTLACPGSGSQDVASLGAYVRSWTGGGSLRCAIYTAAGALVMQGNAKIDVAEYGEYGWQEHTSFVDVNGDAIASPQLTGGTDYLLALSTGGSMYVYSISQGATNGQIKAVNYTVDGFPAALGTGWSGFSTSYSIRCGVEPAAAAPAVRRRRFIL